MHQIDGLEQSSFTVKFGGWGKKEIKESMEHGDGDIRLWVIVVKGYSWGHSY